MRVLTVKALRGSKPKETSEPKLREAHPNTLKSAEAYKRTVDNNLTVVVR